MQDNPLRAILDYGQSIWQDDIRRKMLLSGELKHLIEEDGLRGLTSNPSIFEEAIAASRDYDDDIRILALQGRSADDIYQNLTVKDVQMAADLFRPVYDRSDGEDGFVSLEVNPHLARDVEATLAEARRLWQTVDRPNLMIKVPGTREGLTCIRRLVGEGLNINVTLLFGLPRYREVAEAYIGGLEDRAAANKPLAQVASVASFFLSRIDVWIDPILKKIMDEKRPVADQAARIYGQVAIASAKNAYQIYREIFTGKRFGPLAAKGARPQRVLWASTSTKNPEFSDIKYVEALIGPETVNTLPRQTMDAYRDHGRPAQRLTDGLASAREVLGKLPELGIELDEVTQGLEDQGIDKFIKPYDSLMATLEKARTAALQEPLERQRIEAGAWDHPVKERIARLQQEDFNARLWRKDADLWSRDAAQQKTIAAGMGWLDVVATMQTRVAELTAFRNEVRKAGLRHVVHMGMGGSSLAPLVFERSFPAARDGLDLTVLDTTDPATLQGIENRLPLDKALFIVASKSGTTAEPLAFGDYFYDRLTRIKGEAAGGHFVAITDPGTPLAELAPQRGFRRVFLNFADIGGRYSALSYFGLLPAALMGLNVGEVLMRTRYMVDACGAARPADASPATVLGAALGELAHQGRNKVTFVVPRSIEPLGMWLEQLIAESTGKDSTGLLPVAGEPLGPPSAYGGDRVFVHIRIDNEADERQERSVAALRRAGHPVVTIRMEDRMDIGQEFFRWEIATATAGAVLGINPFDQPNVQESKDNTGRLLKIVREKGGLPETPPDLTEGPLSVYRKSGSTAGGLSRTLGDFFRQKRPGDYIALLAYLTEETAVETLLASLQLRLQEKFGAAVTMGYGPRYLHSTGQFHKGGPDSGLFVQLTCDDVHDLAIPDKPYSFGTLRKAQAQGDLEALDKHGRRAIRIHLGADAVQGLTRLKSALDEALAQME